MFNSIKKIAAEIKRRDLEAIVCCSPDNATYCSGFMVPSHNRNRHRRVFTIITADGEAQLICVTVEENITRANSYIQPVVAYNEFTDDPVQMVCDFLKSKGATQRIAVELSYLFATDYVKLLKYLPNTTIVEAEDIILKLRSIKEEEEIETIRECCKITGAVYNMLRDEARSSMTEMDLYGMCLKEMARRGVEFPRMALGSGSRGADVNVKPSTKKLQVGELVRFDVLGTYGNFNLDIARTATVGKASKEQNDTWARLYEVHRRSIDRIKPGASTKEIYLKFNEDMVKIMKVSGSLNFLGHGLGITCHEPPYFNVSSEEEIKPNMVMCIEPVFLVPGVGGYHIEDCLVVRPEGVEVLSDINFASSLFEIKEG